MAYVLVGAFALLGSLALAQTPPKDPGESAGAQRPPGTPAGVPGAIYRGDDLSPQSPGTREGRKSRSVKAGKIEGTQCVQESAVRGCFTLQDGLDGLSASLYYAEQRPPASGERVQFAGAVHPESGKVCGTQIQIDVVRSTAASGACNPVK